ncbi:hypothetical protein NSTC745_00926 [Nostoc sp. DSM 114161]
MNSNHSEDTVVFVDECIEFCYIEFFISSMNPEVR